MILFSNVFIPIIFLQNSINIEMNKEQASRTPNIKRGYLKE